MIVFHSNWVPDTPDEWPPYFSPIWYPKEWEIVGLIAEIVGKYGDKGVSLITAIIKKP